MANLSLGAKNDSTQEVLRKHLSPALAGRGWDALLKAIAVGDQYKEDLALAAFEQLFKSSATGVYLDRVLSDDGVTRPPGIGIGDEIFRKLGITTTSKKLLVEVILEILETYYGSEAARANSTSTVAEPFALNDGDDLFVEINGKRPVRIEFKTDGFTSIGAATALEVATAITRTLRTLGNSAFAESFQDPETNNSYVRIFSGAIGLSGSVRVTGGSAQNKLIFPSSVHTGSDGPQATTTWNVTPGNGTNGISAGRVRFTWSGGTDPDLIDVIAGDYVNIYGSVFQPANRGAFPILESTITYFEILNILGVSQSGVAQLAASDLIFFRPEKRTIHSTGRMVTASQGEPGVLEVILQATTQAVERGENLAAYLHGAKTQLPIASGSRDKTGLVTVTTTGAHGLTAGNWFYTSGIKPTLMSVSETVADGDPTSVYNGTAYKSTVALDDGRIMVCGGSNTFQDPQDVVYLYSPITGEWSNGEFMNSPRSGHVAVKLNDGRVLAIGGYTTDHTAEIYDPSTDTWSPTSSTVGSYSFCSAVKLLDGRVMVIGDTDSEIYNPATSTWSMAAAHDGFRYNNLSVTLDDGRVLMIGGPHGYGSVYNPLNNSWTTTGACPVVDLNFFVLIKIRDGAMLIGGLDDGVAETACYTFNPSTMQWTTIASLNFGRMYHDATVLSDGSVLVAGGLDDFGAAISATEIYDPLKNKWTVAPWSITATYGAKLHLLGSKNALVVAGVDANFEPVFSQVLVTKYSTDLMGGGLNGFFRVNSAPNNTTLTFTTPDYAIPTTFTSGSIATSRAYVDDVQGPFIFDTSSGIAITEIESTTNVEILGGSSYSTLGIVDASDFPDSEGWLCFGFGTENEVHPVHYLGKISDQALLMDPTYTFPMNLSTGTTVTLLKQRGPWAPPNPEETGSFYLTAASSGRIAASATIDEVVAAGVNVKKVIIYPSDKGLGNEGAADSGSPKISDRVSVWGGDDLDSEISTARE